MLGRRRADLPIGDFHDDVQPGDYWKLLERAGTRPRHSDAPSNLTGTCWYVIAPAPTSHGGYAIGRLELHTVREHEDGTISVLPGDGSSNSIKISGHSGYVWHGFINHDDWQPLPDSNYE